eukprot:s269_g7.t1
MGSGAAFFGGPGPNSTQLEGVPPTSGCASIINAFVGALVSHFLERSQDMSGQQRIQTCKTSWLFMHQESQLYKALYQLYTVINGVMIPYMG